MDFSGWVKQTSKASRVYATKLHVLVGKRPAKVRVHDTRADCSREQHKPAGEACGLLSSNFYMTDVILCLFL